MSYLWSVKYMPSFFESLKKNFSELCKGINNHKHDGFLRYRKLKKQEAENIVNNLRTMYGIPALETNDLDYKTSFFNDKSPLANLSKNISFSLKFTQDSSNNPKKVKISSEEILKLQKTVKVYFKGKEVDANTSSEACKYIHHLFLLKKNKSIPKEQIPEKYNKKGGVTEYKNLLEKETYRVVLRFESLSYVDNEQKLRKQPVHKVYYDSHWPKLLHYGSKTDYQSYAFREFVENSIIVQKKQATNGKLKNKEKLKNYYKKIISDYVKIASDNQEILSMVTPGAFIKSLDEKEQEKAIRCFLKALAEVIKTVEDDIKEKLEKSAYKGFKGVLICCENTDIYNKEIGSQYPLIYKNPLCASVLTEISATCIGVAEPLMSEAFSSVGNGALGRRALVAKDERDMRNSFGVNAAIANPLYNQNLSKLIDAINSSAFQDAGSTSINTITSGSPTHSFSSIFQSSNKSGRH